MDFQHLFTIDVECWYDLTNQSYGRPAGINHEALARQMDCVLAILANHSTYATFFLLGTVAQRMPALAPRLVALGHEVGLHGGDHRPLYEHSPSSLRECVSGAKKLLEDQTGAAIRSHRAPAFSILKQNLWALDILAECGLRIDSSIFPARLRRYGIDGFPRRPHFVTGPGGGTLFEVPLSVVEWCGRIWPISGGGYARLAPAWLLAHAARKLEQEGLPLVLYFHPYEFDPNPLRPPDGLSAFARARLRARWNLRRKTIPLKVRRLLSSFRFGRVDKYAEQAMQQAAPSKPSVPS